VARAAKRTLGDVMTVGKPVVTGGITAAGKNDVTAITPIHDIRSQLMRTILGLFLLILIGASVSGCVIEEPGGWHHYHHYDHG
jgi:hypothetical protein